MFPSNGCLKRRPLRSTGPCGPVPPLRRYYGTLRLPAVPLAALRCLRLAIPPLRSICSHRPERTAGGTGSWCSGSRAGHVGGNGRASQVPERPSCPCALFLDPGRTELRQAIAAPRRGPRLCQQRWPPRAKISGPDRTALGLAVYASQWRPPCHHARFASGCWLGPAGRDSLTRGVAMKGFRVRASSSLLELT